MAVCIAHTLGQEKYSADRVSLEFSHVTQYFSAIVVIKTSSRPLCYRSLPHLSRSAARQVNPGRSDQP